MLLLAVPFFLSRIVSYHFQQDVGGHFDIETFTRTVTFGALAASNPTSLRLS